jgi:hypothetical protein
VETEAQRRFPLKEAYAFASKKGLGAEVSEIRKMAIDWNRPYKTTVRRGRMILLLKNDLVQFQVTVLRVDGGGSDLC